MAEYSTGRNTQASGSDNPSTSGVLWDAVFQSAEFVSGFKSLVKDVLQESRGPVEQAHHVKQLGDQAHTFRNDCPSTEVGSEPS